jgi:hypothetical protein
VTRPVSASRLLTCCALTLWFGIPAQAADLDATSNGQELQTIVVQATAIPGAMVEADKIPGNVQSLSAADLRRNGTASLTGTMDSVA